uniref:Prokaryotic lipoprotein-attachment site n=1 Tax=Candidatus Kentrum sp. LFY TaxID=2126342 RepID=A0A450WP77_9GAMM|nr:MAG: Prokaryotic lipoprotein-attachment site [Candidatus Kentron sp. LFY]VFK00262.1 MAG: Prokaryotic lipoprotein-attachment site [Candidatus Kentron sp. LFY]VFK18820.1 MAG: Prokaryotic lipoprotein-attachment site [Candidatus Kentron sp. LFY]
MEILRNKIRGLRWLLVALLLPIGLQAGCGQKGPLYFPDEAKKAFGKTKGGPEETEKKALNDDSRS